MNEERVCQDCGVIVERMSNGHWGQPKGPSTWSGVCRVTLSTDRTRMLAADYHYVKGEQQRTFKAHDA